MTMQITLGPAGHFAKGTISTIDRNPDALVEVLNNHQGHRAWWAPKVWKDDHRTNDNWLLSSALVADVDWTGPDGKHLPKGVDSKAPAEAHAALLEALTGRWAAGWSLAHASPRGARLVWILEDDLTDVLSYAKAQKLVARLAGGFCTGIAINGWTFEEDAKTRDMAHMFYAPRASTAEDGLRAPVWGPLAGRSAPFGLPELVAIAEENGFAATQGRRLTKAVSGAVRAAMGGVSGLDEEAIAGLLLKEPAEGANDGSLEAIKVARKAIGLGVLEAEVFVRCARAWNARRVVPWTDEQLGRKYEDARGRWDAEGMAPGVMPGKYSRPALEKILREDRDFAGLVTKDLLRGEVLYRGRPLGEVDVTGAEVSICKKYGYLSISREALWTGFELEGAGHAFDPVADYLNGLVWDGVERLGVEEGALVDRLRVVAPERALAAAYWRCTLVAAVARVAWPGCKHDHVPVLVGPDMAGKSTALRVLAGDDWFADSHIDPESKDAYLQMKGKWIYEFSELDGLAKKTDVARIKSFVSSQVDNYRPPYGRVASAHPRRCIFIGTSNTGDILQDVTSSRRWWVMEVERGIDVAWLRASRDQLWAEASERLAAGEKWWLDTEQEAERASANENYFADNVTHSDVFSEGMERREKQGLNLDEFWHRDFCKNCWPGDSRISVFDNRKLSNSLIAQGFKKSTRVINEKTRARGVFWSRSKAKNKG